MHDPGIPLSDLLFTFVVCAAVLALFTEYAEHVVIATLFLFVLQLVDLLGASLLLATMLLVLATMLRAVALLVEDADVGTPLLAQALDDLLTRPAEREPDEPDRRGHQVAVDRLDHDAPGTDDHWQ